MGLLKSVGFVLVLFTVDTVYGVNVPHLQAVVLRGGQTELDLHIQAAGNCIVQHVASRGLACGAVSPESFQCGSSDNVVYQHYGCFSDYEIVSFEVSTRPENSSGWENTDGKLTVEFFSVEIHIIEDLHSNLASIQWLGHREFRVEFPSALVGQCYYEVVSHDPLLPLPLAGELLGVSNHPLPCGFTPKTALQYRSITSSQVDYVLVRVRNSCSERRNTTYVILTLQLSEPNGHMLELPATELTVQQATNTPIPAELFPAIHSNTNEFKYLFLSQHAGTFTPVYASPSFTKHTVFTIADLRNHLVAFLPNDSYNVTVTYNYSVLDMAGWLLAKGTVRVHLFLRNWNEPSQRANKGLSTVAGGTAIMDRATLDFYVLVECQLHLLLPPSQGKFSLADGSPLTDRGVPLWSMRNGSTSTVYRHWGSFSLADGCIWELRCGSLPPLKVFVAIHIAPQMEQLTVQLQGRSYTAYQGLAMPLSPSILHLPSPHPLSPLIEVGTLLGKLVRYTGQPCATRTAFYPYTRHLESTNVSIVERFLLSELTEQNVWYIPPNNTSLDTVQFTLVASGMEASPLVLNVTIVATPLEDHLMLSTMDSYPRLLRNTPLPLVDNLSVYITARYLHASPLHALASNIVYTVHSGPEHGLLCVLSQNQCNTSTRNFAQSEVAVQRVFYQPTEATPTNDSFLFSVTVDGVNSYNSEEEQLVFQIISTRSRIRVGKQFWINIGGEKAISAKYIRPVTKQFSTKNLTFIITSDPVHGTLLLSVDSPFSFTFADVLKRRVKYRHNGSIDHHCSDSFNFTLTDGTLQHSNTFSIAVKQSSKEKIRDLDRHNRTLLGQSSFVFSSHDISVRSPFCPQFVLYTIVQLPSLGALTLYHTELDIVLQLGLNSSFTAADVRTGLLQYSLKDISTSHFNTSDSFGLTVSDPAALLHNISNRINEDTPDSFHFEVLIVRDTEHSISIDICSPRPVTWLPDYAAYGYIFQAEDFRVEGGGVEPSTVQIEAFQPALGKLQRESSQFSPFSLEEVQQGLIRYQLTQNALRGLRKTTEESFRFKIWLENFLAFALPNFQLFTLELYFVQIAQQRYTVEETAGNVTIVIRRKGSTRFESRVSVGTQPLSATATLACSSPEPGADYCGLQQEVVFLPGASMVTVAIPILDDDIAEDEEQFQVTLLSPSNAILTPSRSQAYITINSRDDFAVISFAPLMLSEPHRDPRNCQQELRVREAVGTLDLVLTRSTHLEEEVGVVCYTEADVARVGDFRVRPKNHSSLVTFAPYQTEAHCPVVVLDDELNESTEKFLVWLGEPVGPARVNTTSSPLCVFLTPDSQDYPEVFFVETSLTVRESMKEEVTVTLRLKRRPADPNPSRLTIGVLSMPGDSARASLDYRPFPGSCGEETECVLFSDNEMEAQLELVVLPDTEQESPRSLHVHIREGSNARIGSPDTVRITILDASEPAIVGFEGLHFQFEETRGDVTLSLLRSGNLDTTIRVNCVLKPETASGDDFIMPDRPQMVEFRPGRNMSACHVFILDDSMWEREESFTVCLITSNQNVEIHSTHSIATVVITDREDEPVVQFTSSQYEVQEPLSNFPPDLTFVTLTVTRGGDLSLPSTLTFSTLEATAEAGIDFRPAAGMLTFQRGQNVTSMAVQVLSNHQSQESVVFHVALTDSSAVRVGEPGQTAVLIHNRPVAGVFFPDLPLLASPSPHGEILYGAQLPSDGPLICVTPCDPLYNSLRGTDYSRECARQHIDPALTEFTWYSFTNGSVWQPVLLDTVFSSVHHRLLEGVYLQENTTVSCSAQAVDSGQAKGHTRSSLPSTLVLPLACTPPNPIAVTTALSSYSGFGAREEDLVHLTVSLPYVPHAIPLISARPLEEEELLSLMTHPPFRLSHPCSTLLGPFLSEASLLKHTVSLEWGREAKAAQLYQHLHWGSCQWFFEAWLPVATLESICGASWDSSTLRLSLYSVYVHVTPDGTLIPTWAGNTAAGLETGAATPLTIPFRVLPSSGAGDAELFPLAVQYNNTSNILELFLYSIANFVGWLSLAEETDGAVTLLHTSLHQQAWLLHTPLGPWPPIQITLHLELAPCSQEQPLTDCTAPSHSFSLDVLPQAVRGRAALATMVHISLQDSTNFSAMGSRIGPFAPGKVVHGLLLLASSQRLTMGFSLGVWRVLLCTDSSNSTPLYHPELEQYGCIGKQSSLSVLERSDDTVHSDAGFEASFTPTASPDRAAFQFRTTPVYQRQSDKPWFIHIVYGVENEGAPPYYYQHSILPLPLSVPELADSALVYATIAVVVSAVLLVAVGLLVLAALCWCYRTKQRSLLYDEGGVNAVKNSELALSSQEEVLHNLRRTASTTGFPTAEKCKRQHVKKSPGRQYHRQTPAPTGPVPPRSRSLPNLSLPAIRSKRVFPAPHRRNLGKPFTTIKMLNNPSRGSREAIWHGHKDLTSIKVIQNDLGSRQLHTQRSELLVSYAVHSLAASANTPEPGSHPATEL